MKFIFRLLLILICAINTSYGQALFAVNSFTENHIQFQDSVVVVSTLGATCEGETIQDSLMVITDFIIPTFLNTNPTLTDDIVKMEGIQLYPNPVPDALMLHRDNWKEDYIVEIFQTSGQSVRKMKWDAGIENLQMSCGNFTRGIYFIAVSNYDLSKRATF